MMILNEVVRFQYIKFNIRLLNPICFILSYFRLNTYKINAVRSSSFETMVIISPGTSVLENPPNKFVHLTLIY